MNWNIEKGKRYVITVHLNYMESFAPDNLITAKFTENGFSNVVVTGKSKNKKVRIIEGTWNKENTIIPEEKHIYSILAKNDLIN